MIGKFVCEHNPMSTQKKIISITLAIISLVGSIACMWIVGTKTSPTPTENVLVSIILFFASSVFSIIVGHYYARLSTSEKIDTIAERSAEKMLNLTTQIEGLALYLEETPDVADEERDNEAALNAYRHRSQGAVLLARSLSSSNDVFSSDWLGVASPSMAEKIQTRFNDLRSRAETSTEYEELQQRVARLGDSQSAIAQQMHSRLQELRARLDSPAGNLPQIPRLGSTPAKAVDVTQITEEAVKDKQRGSIVIRLLRALKSVTGTGKFEPEMRAPPMMNVTLVGHPPELNISDFEYRSATGTKYDFHVNMKYRTFGNLLPLGDYSFEFEASCDGAKATPTPQAG